MQLRRLRPSRRSHRLTLLAAGVLLASPMLGGCGFNYATNRVNTISAGINDRSQTVDVLGAIVIAGQDGAGLFVASFVNKDQDDEISLEGVKQTDEILPLDPGAPLPIAAGGIENLLDSGGLPISGQFGAGDFVPVTLTFSNGQVTTVEVSVVPPCHQYAIDELPDGIELPTPPAIDPGDGTGEATGEEAGTESGTETEAETEADDEGEYGKYSCKALPDVPHHGEAEVEGEGAEGEGTE